MTLRFLADENFDNDIMRGLKRVMPDIEMVRVQDIAELQGAEDPVVLAWAAQRGYIVFTHDVRTMTYFAFERVNAGLAMPGVVEIRRNIPIGKAIEELQLFIECSKEGEWEGQVKYIPL